MNLPTLNLIALLPQIILVVTSLVVLMLDLGLRDKRPLGWLSLVGVLAALAAVLFVQPATPDFQGMALADGLGLFAAAAVLIATGLGILLALERAGDFTRWHGAYHALLLLAATGMLAMAKGSDFLTIFLGLEVFSLSLYILVGFNRRDVRSGEAALKYFLLGAFASAFFLYGIALIYAATGTTNLAAIRLAILPMSLSLPFKPLLPAGIGLLLVGYGFKVALVPFHMWTPDAYQGAPTPVTAFMSVATKTAAFGSLIRVLAAIVSVERPWLLALAGIAALTMTLGNLAALRQISLKRMLAYSSIAHAGYVLVALAAGTLRGYQAALYYLLAYTFMNLGAFAALLAVQNRDENDVMDEQMRGLANRQPLLAALMAVLLFSLTGIPPMAGFFGKLYAFSAAVEAGLVWLVIVAVINSAIGAYYYLRITVLMYMAEPSPATPRTSKPGPAVWVSVVVAAVGTVVLGLWQWPWTQTIAGAVASLVTR